jgi:alkanesulfonate monooxygenase SsuD/methylene tetrahydromethanopterin reductase-like flavin-dependent oxidoreductase (luciferase family)
MKIGISLTSAYNVKDPRDGARWMIERARAARAAGLDSLFIGDHHATAYPYYQNTPMLGRLLAEWGASPAGCLFLLPLWNPVLVAEQVGTLAAIAQGRFIFQCGLGDDERQFAAMGARIKNRTSAFEESFVAVQRLLNGEAVSGSRRFEFRDARVTLLPAEPVEYWIGASAEPAIDRAARLGDGWIASPAITLEEARAQLGYYLERCSAHGRKPTAIAIRRDIYVGESEQDAEETAKRVMEKGYRGFRRPALVIGGVDTVTRKFRSYAEAGYTDLIVRHVTLDQARVLNSMARLAEVRHALMGA